MGNTIPPPSQGLDLRSCIGNYFPSFFSYSTLGDGKVSLRSALYRPALHSKGVEIRDAPSSL